MFACWLAKYLLYFFPSTLNELVSIRYKLKQVYLVSLWFLLNYALTSFKSNLDEILGFGEVSCNIQIPFILKTPCFHTLSRLCYLRLETSGECWRMNDRSHALFPSCLSFRLLPVVPLWSGLMGKAYAIRRDAIWQIIGTKDVFT